MPHPASFSVRPQHAHPDENTGYNTQPAFVIPGSKAAERNARRKKGSIPALQTVPNRRWEASGSIHPQYSAPHGLMTPKTPDSFLMDVDSGYHYRPGQEDMFAVPLIPQDCSNGFYPDYYTSHPVVQNPSSFLPITPSPNYTPIQHWSESGPHESNSYSPSAYPESQSLMPDSDYCLDHWDGHMFANNLSPLAIDNRQLLPAFKDTFGNDLSPASPTDTKPRL
ncbi:hypothetical protein BYT27DRAFT_7248989 [Phlegmacium glaucopus]|nr:hypothetical protein BYT27DRAFT_7248989 [Phlegmacium glaucopus]